MKAAANAQAWKFLTDSAVRERNQDRFGVHSAYAKVLYDIAKTCDTPFSIGLYSNWGSGKTSICNLLENLTKQDTDLHYVYLDLWKYSRDPLKRWILLETCRSLTDQKVLANYELDGRSLQSHLEFEESWDDKKKIKVDLKAARFLTIALIAIIGVSILFHFYLSSATPGTRAASLIADFVLIGATLSFIVESVFKEFFKTLAGLVVERSVKHVSAKPAFSSEKFGAIFHDMIVKATTSTTGKTGRVIFCFDNLDRCSEDVAVEAISVIKSYLDEPGCVYITPCDETAILKHIIKSYTSDNNQDDARQYAKEFLNKFFQVTLRLPVSTETDIESYLDNQLNLIQMSDLTVDAKDVLVLGYLGQTPRQVKRVLNDLVAFRSLAVQAETDGLVESGALTKDLALLTKLCIISSEWPDFLNKIADDPELWSEIQDQLARDENISKKDSLDSNLATFLRATRHVSPQADIRPFVYLKRIKHEANLPLTKSVEEFLKKGETAEFMALLERPETADYKDAVIEVVTDRTRHWLNATPPRDTFLKNAAATLLKLSIAFPSSRDLELITSDLLGKFSTMNAHDLAGVVSLADVFAFRPKLQPNQRALCLDKLVDLLDSSAAYNQATMEYWELFLANSDELTSPQKHKLSAYLDSHYESVEDRVLLMLRKASTVDSNTDWVINDALLEKIAKLVTFVGDPPDDNRIAILLKYQKLLIPKAKNLIVVSITTALVGTRTRVIDKVATSAIKFLKTVDLGIFNSSDIDGVAATIVEQITQSTTYQGKGAWLSPLIDIYPSLSTATQSTIDPLYRTYLLDTPNPVGVVEFLTSMGRNACERLLEMPENITVLRDAASKLETTYPPPETAKMHRSQILACFSAISLIEKPSYVDASKEWDVQVYESLFLRAKQEGSSPDVLISHIGNFIENFIVGQTPARLLTYDGMTEILRKNPDLLDENVALLLTKCTTEILDEDVEKYLKDLDWLSQSLSHSHKVATFKAVIDTILKAKGPQWVKALTSLSKSVSADAALCSQERLVSDLCDYAFEAARTNPTDAREAFELLAPCMSKSLRNANCDKAVDRLIAEESNGDPVSQMEPFLYLIESAGDSLPQSTHPRLATFVLRMLSAAKSDEDHVFTLNFLTKSGAYSFIVNKITERVRELAKTEGSAGEAAGSLMRLARIEKAVDESEHIDGSSNKNEEST